VPVETLVKDKRSLLVVPARALTALPLHLLEAVGCGARQAGELGVATSDIHLGADASETAVKRAPLADYGIVYCRLRHCLLMPIWCFGAYSR
jgi:hypothetical protein